MNVYDFDKTIFYPDSMVNFKFFCIGRHPKLIFAFFPKLCESVIKFLFKKAKLSHILATMHGIIKYLKDPDKDIALYWKKYEKNIAKWYLAQKRDDDLIISGSPEYLLKPIADKLGVKVIGTIIDRETGVMIGNLRMGELPGN